MASVSHQALLMVSAGSVGIDGWQFPLSVVRDTPRRPVSTFNNDGAWLAALAFAGSGVKGVQWQQPLSVPKYPSRAVPPFNADGGWIIPKAPAAVAGGVTWQQPLSPLTRSIAFKVPSIIDPSSYAASWLVAPAITPATWDPTTGANVTISGGNLVCTNNSTFFNQGIQIAVASRKTTGKYYVEFTLTTITTADSSVMGVFNGTGSYTNITNNLQNGAYISYNGSTYTGGVGTGITLGNRSAGDVIGMAYDMANGKIWFRVAPSGNWNANATFDPATNVGGTSVAAGTMGPVNAFGGAACQPNNAITTNFGASAFSGAVPSGFTAGWPV